MRKPALLACTAAALLVLLWAGTARAQGAELNRVADGDFESGFISLHLPPGARFPLFSGGWASRGERLPELIEGAGFAGRRALRLAASPSDPLQLLQDVPLGVRAYGMRFAFLIEHGVQSVRLLDEWQRGDRAGEAPAFEARIGADGIRFTTPAGSWWLTKDLSVGRWHVLSVIADPRTGVQNVRLDGAPLIALPGVANGRPSTLVVDAAAGTSAFRWDAFEVVSLADLELATIRAAVDALGAPATTALLDRLDAAATALARGGGVLALPELDVARRMLEEAAPGAVNLRGALGDLIALIEADRRRTGGDGPDLRGWF